MKIPIQCNREITYILYNYNNIDKLIEERKNFLIDNIAITNKAYLKAIKSKNSNTLEDVVMKFDSDKYIKRLKKWKKLINSFCNKLYDDERKFYYYFIKYKYFIKKDDEFIKEHMNLNNNEFNQINNYLKWVIYQYAVIDNLYSERRLYS